MSLIKEANTNQAGLNWETNPNRFSVEWIGEIISLVSQMTSINDC